LTAEALIGIIPDGERNLNRQNRKNLKTPKNSSAKEKEKKKKKRKRKVPKEKEKKLKEKKKKYANIYNI